MSHEDGTNSPGSRAEAIDKLLVEGELVPDQFGEEVRAYPKSMEIAKRLDVSCSYVSKYAKKNRCFQRRREFLARVHEEVRDELAKREGKRLAFGIEKSRQLVASVLEKYAESIEVEGVNRPTSADVNTMVRLQQYLDGNADERQEVMGGLTLEAIQLGHKQMLDDLQRITPEERGIVDGGPLMRVENPRAASIEEASLAGQLDVDGE